jgi:hypothetical protein
MAGTVPRRVSAVNGQEAEPHSTVFQRLYHNAWRRSSQADGNQHVPYAHLSIIFVYVNDENN